MFANNSFFGSCGNITDNFHTKIKVPPALKTQNSVNRRYWKHKLLKNYINSGLTKLRQLLFPVVPAGFT